MNYDFFTIILIILVIGLLYYSSLYQINKCSVKEPLMGSIRRAIRDVNRFPGRINNFFRQVSGQIRRVGTLGRRIGALGRQISRFPRRVGSEIGGVWNRAQGAIKNEFQKVEGFAKDLAGKVEGYADDLAGEVTDIAGEIGEVIEDIPGEVEGLSRSIFLDKIPKFFQQVWGWIKRTIIDPVVGFFYNIGDIFTDIGNIFVEMFAVLMRIPACIPIYMFDASKAIIWNVYLSVFPKWIKDFNRSVDRNYKTYVLPILIPIFDGLLFIIKTIFELFGFQLSIPTWNTAKCYDFGPLGKIIEEIIGFMMLVFNGIAQIFGNINIMGIINQIISIF